MLNWATRVTTCIDLKDLISLGLHEREIERVFAELLSRFKHIDLS